MCQYYQKHPVCSVLEMLDLAARIFITFENRLSQIIQHSAFSGSDVSFQSS